MGGSCSKPQSSPAALPAPAEAENMEPVDPARPYASDKANDALEQLARNDPTLRELFLSREQIADLAPLAAALAHNSTLTRLYLNNNQIADLAPLAAALKHNSKLEGLWLSDNQIAELDPLAAVLTHNSTLTWLGLNGNQIADLGPLAAALAHNSTLTTLSLSDNRIVDLAHLATALERNSTLKRLFLSGNQITDLAPLAAALAHNSTLTELGLEGNQITDLAPLAAVLTHNSTLIQLYLSGNQITDLAPLAAVLAHNSTLREMSLSLNQIADLAPLAEAMETNTTLTEVTLEGNPIEDKLALIRISVLLAANQNGTRNQQPEAINTATKAQASAHWGVAPADLVPVSGGWDDQANCPIIAGYAPPAPRPPWLPDSGPGQRNVVPLCWSLSVEQWVTFIHTCKQTDTWKALVAVKGEYNISMRDINEHFVVPWSRGTGCSIALLMNAAQQSEAECMLSHSWDGSVVETYNCLQNMVNHQGVPKTARIFFCTLSMYQPEDGAANGLSISEQLAMEPFNKIIESRPQHGARVIHTTVSEVYGRKWVAHEANVAINAGIELTGLFDMYRWYQSVEEFEQTTIKTEDGECSREEDRQYIDNLVEQYGGYQRLDETIKDFRSQMGRQLRDFLGSMQGGNHFQQTIFDWAKGNGRGAKWKFADVWDGKLPLGQESYPLGQPN